MTTNRSRTPPDFPAHGSGCDHSRPITVLKLHGSLNWFVRIQGQRPTARVLSGQGERDLFISRMRLVPTRLRWTSQKKGRGRTKWYTWPVVIPPIYGKQALIRGYVQAAWEDARVALRVADRILFVGYSLPLLDIEAEKMFARAIAGNSALPWVGVVNPDPASAQRYATMAHGKPIRWYPSIESVLAGDLLR
jgi:hypothetical protein